MEKITIHRALAELKLIDAKIEKGIADIYPTAICQKGKKIDGFLTEEEFNSNALSAYDSVSDLIGRKVKIKSAIVKSNAITSVQVGETQMSVSDAISYKKIITLKEVLKTNLKAKHTGAVAAMNKNNDIVGKNCDTLLLQVAGKDTKTSKEDLDAVSKPYLDNNIFSLIDPLKVTDKVASLEKEIGDFSTQVDACLSESNAVTFIEI